MWKRLRGALKGGSKGRGAPSAPLPPSAAPFPPSAAASTALPVAEARAGPPSAEPDYTAWWIPKGETVTEAPQPKIPRKGGDPALYDRLAETLSGDDLKLPAFPPVAQRAIALLQREDMDFAGLADLVGRDQALAAGILRLVNSPAYRGVTDIVRLDLALARLGRRTVRGTLMGTAMRSLTGRTEGIMRMYADELWFRSLASAIVLEEAAPKYRLSADDGFVVGLLHDIGMAAILRVARDEEIRSRREVPRPVFELLSRDLHETVGARLAEQWGLPQPLPSVAGDHHRNPSPDDPHLNWRLLVQLADVTCAMSGYSPYVPYDFFEVPCVQRLGLRDTAATRRLLGSMREKIVDSAEWL